jgi:4-hydroxy-tetrahydrodipicolinate synthase
MQTYTHFYGSYVALTTPFTPDGMVDYTAFENLIAWHMQQGTHGLVPCGTTGEAPTLSIEEHKELIRVAVQIAGKRLKILAGTGSNNTSEAIELTRYAEEMGADGALLITPYYNKPTQAGLYAHFEAIHHASTIPLMLYDVPGRTVARLSDETVIKLAALPRIFGIKDATADLARPLALHQALPDFRLFSGEDATVLAFYAQGGHGCISVVANVAPRLCADLYNAFVANDWKQAQQLNERLYPLARALFLETSPAPVKYALHLLKQQNNTLRLPLVAISSATAIEVEAALRFAGLL